MIGKEVYMVDYVRTPFSRARPRTPPRDAFSDIPGVELAAETLINMFDVRLKDKVEKKEVGEYIFGCGMPIGENFLASGKLALWLAKFPNEIPAFATERQCGSGMTALHHGVMDIAMGYCDTVLITGMESQTREPMHNNKNLSFNTKVVDPRSRWYNGDLDIITGMVMIQTAQKLWEEESDHFSKEDMDKIGARSHRLAAEAQEAGFFKDEIVPIMAHEEGNLNNPQLIDHDLAVRKGTTVEKMATLKGLSRPGWAGGYKNPRFTKKEYIERFGTPFGMITAGNASPMNAGAASILLMSKEKMEAKGLKPLAKIVDMGFAGVDPSVMGRGPVPASKMALKHAGLTADQIDFWEINEAFCIVSMNCTNKLGIDPEKVNIHGGATAIGHPLAATGVRMPGTLARILKEKKTKYGLANMCCGGGQGTAVILENTEV